MGSDAIPDLIIQLGTAIEPRIGTSGFMRGEKLKIYIKITTYFM